MKQDLFPEKREGGTVLLSPFSHALRFGPLVRQSKLDCGCSPCIAI